MINWRLIGRSAPDRGSTIAGFEAATGNKEAVSNKYNSYCI